MSYKVDLHSHSIASPDGGLTAQQYKKALESGIVDCVAITDHNRIDFAALLHKELGDKVIIGEEIMSSAGEIVGLFLERPIKAGLSPLETVKQIKDQGGIVYIPHPFESVRKGLHPHTLEELAGYIDIVEICNGRAFFQNRSSQAVVWARLNHKLGAASSDAHGTKGLGKTYTLVSELPTRTNLLQQLINATPITDRPGVRALLYPKYHSFRKKIRGQA
jgi:predicted metal-dependent phosphoesterase TrpH